MTSLHGRDMVSGAQTTAARGTALPGRRLLLITSVAVVLGGCMAFAVGLMIFARSIATLETERVARADAIVVLTGGSQRLSDGLGLLADGQGRKLLLSGVYQRTSREELARHVTEGHLWLDCCVDLGKSARNTIGNAIEARRWAQAQNFKSLIVVTSNYHMPRTLREFEHAFAGVRLTGYPVVSDGVDVTRMWSDPVVFRIIAAEYAKYLVSGLRRTFERDPENSRWPVLVGRQKPIGPWVIERAGG